MVGVLLNALVRVNFQPQLADRVLVRGLAEQWRTQVLPRYRRLVADGEAQVEGAPLDRLFDIVDAVASTAGAYLWSLAIVGGSAWKMEGCLARFLRQHLPHAAQGNVQVLLRGLPGAALDGLPAHAVQSVDWYWPTASELGWTRDQPDLIDRHQQLSAERRAAETACRAALAKCTVP